MKKEFFHEYGIIMLSVSMGILIGGLIYKFHSPVYVVTTFLFCLGISFTSTIIGNRKSSN